MILFVYVCICVYVCVCAGEGKGSLLVEVGSVCLPMLSLLLVVSKCSTELKTFGHHHSSLPSCRSLCLVGRFW